MLALFRCELLLRPSSPWLRCGMRWNSNVDVGVLLEPVLSQPLDHQRRFYQREQLHGVGRTVRVVGL